MPIHGLTADLTDEDAEVPRLGLLRKGAPKPKRGIGKDLTYFRFVTENPEIEAKFSEAYGNEPRTINVHLLFPEVEKTFPTWMELHGKGSLKHRCDGKMMILWQDDEGLYHTDPQPCPWAHLPKNHPDRQCKETGILHVLVDDLGHWGYVDVLTGSKWDCIGLHKNILAVRNMAQLVSSIKGQRVGIQAIPCELKRGPRMISCPSPDGNGPRVRREKWLLSLEVAPWYIQEVMKSFTAYSLPGVEAPQLVAPDVTQDIELDYYVPNGDDDIEHPEVEVFEPDPEPDIESETNGKRFYKSDFIARIQELMTEAEDLEAPKNYDQAVLDEADMDELKRIGQELKEYVETVKAAKTEQAEIPFE